MEHVYIVFSSWMRNGDTDVRKVEAVCKKESTAMSIIHDLVVKDLEFGDFWDNIGFCETTKENSELVQDGENLPEEFIKHFIAQDKEQMPEFVLEYFYEEHSLV